MILQWLIFSYFLDTIFIDDFPLYFSYSIDEIAGCFSHQVAKDHPSVVAHNDEHIEEHEEWTGYLWEQILFVFLGEKGVDQHVDKY